MPTTRWGVDPALGGPLPAISVPQAPPWLTTVQLKGLESIRQLVRRSFPIAHYQPEATDRWEKHWPGYASIVEKNV